MNAAASFGAALFVVLLLGRRATAIGSRRVAAQSAAPTRRFRAEWVRYRKTRQRTAVGPSELARWSDDLARSLRHGSTLHAALQSTIPESAAVARHADALRHLLDRGATAAQACDRWIDDPERSSEPLLGTLAAVLTATATIGGSASAPLDRCAAAMRQRSAEHLERRAHSAQAAMSARVLTIVPVVVLLILALADADVRSVIAQPAGAMTVGAGLALNVVGSWWMRRIVGRNHESATA